MPGLTAGHQGPARSITEATMMILSSTFDPEGIHTRPNGDDFEVYRRGAKWYWSNCTTQDGFVVEHLGAESGPFDTAAEAYADA